jgi:hypothetical protein
MKALAGDGASRAPAERFLASHNVQKEINCSNIDIAPDLGICHPSKFVVTEQGSGFFSCPERCRQRRYRPEEGENQRENSPAAIFPA